VHGTDCCLPVGPSRPDGGSPTRPTAAGHVGLAWSRRHRPQVSGRRRPDRALATRQANQHRCWPGRTSVGCGYCKVRSEGVRLAHSAGRRGCARGSVGL